MTKESLGGWVGTCQQKVMRPGFGVHVEDSEGRAADVFSEP